MNNSVYQYIVYQPFISNINICTITWIKCFWISGNAIPGSRQKRDSDLGDTCLNLLDTCNGVSYCDGTVGTCKMYWWFILILIIIVFLVIGLILLAIWKALGLSCTKVKLMMMMAWWPGKHRKDIESTSYFSFVIQNWLWHVFLHFYFIMIELIDHL